MYCWGDNSFGQLGIQQVQTISTSLPQSVSFPKELGTARISKLFAGVYTTFALDSERRLWAWGWNAAGLLAIGSTDDLAHTVPAFIRTNAVPGADALRVRTMTVTRQSACALTATGDILCWGTNIEGTMGQSPPAPLLDSGSFVPVKAFDAPLIPPGPNALFAQTVNSSALCYAAGVEFSGLKCWGRGNSFQLLLLTDYTDAAEINAMAGAALINAGLRTPFKKVVLGRFFGAALDASGRVAIWGGFGPAYPIGGSIEAGVASELSASTDAGKDGNWTDITSGSEHLCLLDGARRVRCMGRNDQLALGRPPIDSSIPQDYDTPDYAVRSADGVPLERAQSVYAGLYHSCAVVDGSCDSGMGGQVACWGDGDYGKLGNGLTAHSFAAVGVKPAK